MPRFAANISTMFGEWPFLERISTATSVGSGGVECQWPYEFDAGDVQKYLVDADIPMVFINAPCGNLDAGGAGLASLPGRGERGFRDSIEQAARYAHQISCSQVHVLAGIPASSGMSGRVHPKCAMGGGYVQELRHSIWSHIRRNGRVGLRWLGRVRPTDFMILAMWRENRKSSASVSWVMHTTVPHHRGAK